MDDTIRRNLLEGLRGLGSDADGHPDMTQVFLPLQSHAAALEPAKWIIRGERGAGKTALFHLINKLSGKEDGLPRLFPSAKNLKIRWVEGFSEKGKAHPSTEALDYFGEQADDTELRAFWFGHLIGRLADSRPEVESPPDSFMSVWSAHRTEPAAWVDAARTCIGPLTTWLDRLDDRFVSDEEWVFVAYDHLDKIGVVKPKVRKRFASTLLAMWLSLGNRYDRLRGKIFIREDLFQSSLHASTDAGKLANRSISLSWSTEDLYRVLLRHMGAVEGLRDWLIGGEIKIPLAERTPLGWFPPDAFPEEGGCSQRSFAKKIAGELMGAGVKKGYTHRWIPNHLQDAHASIVPRSILNLMAFSADWALQRGSKAGQSRLLHPTELHEALVRTSEYRANELVEEHRVVRRLENLRGIVLLASQGVVRSKLRMLAAGGEEDGFGDDGGAVLAELVNLGVLKERSDGRIDVPDIYRYGFGIKRKGGVARPR